MRILSILIGALAVAAFALARWMPEAPKIARVELCTAGCAFVALSVMAWRAV